MDQLNKLKGLGIVCAKYQCPWDALQSDIPGQKQCPKNGAEQSAVAFRGVDAGCACIKYKPAD